MSRYIDADAIKDKAWKAESEACFYALEDVVSVTDIDEAPSIEPNLILPERMERGDIYEVGETIVVMNRDDYYDLLCKSWMPKRDERNRR